MNHDSTDREIGDRILRHARSAIFRHLQLVAVDSPAIIPLLEACNLLGKARAERAKTETDYETGVLFVVNTKDFLGRLTGSEPEIAAT